MKTTTVPAQVTTVEDKIAGNLNLNQLLLLALSVFVGFALYVVFPPSMKLSIVKVLLCLMVMFVFASLAVRVKGKLIMQWMVLLLRYNLRPRYYLFNKNDAYLRIAMAVKDPPQVPDTVKQRKTTAIVRPTLPVLKIVQLQDIITDPRAKLTFHTSKKGGLHVRITEIKQEG